MAAGWLVPAGQNVSVTGEGASDAPDREAVPALLELWKGTSDRTVERRAFEWKIAFGIWAAQLATIALLIQHHEDLGLADRTDFSDEYLFAGVALAGLHALYLIGFIRVRNARDARIGVQYERAIIAALGVTIELEAPAVNVSEPWFKRWWWTGWSFAQLFEVGVSGFLAYVGPAAIDAW
jgi:hypothetical protein